MPSPDPQADALGQSVSQRVIVIALSIRDPCKPLWMRAQVIPRLCGMDWLKKADKICDRFSHGNHIFRIQALGFPSV